jgi:hypothetical protein
MSEPERPSEVNAGGLWCHEVLDRLPDLLEGTLPEAERGQIHDHLAACTWCERFGGAYIGTVQAAREALDVPPPDEVLRRLDERLRSGS